jgi:hypothetical protein
MTLLEVSSSVSEAEGEEETERSPGRWRGPRFCGALKWAAGGTV